MSKRISFITLGCPKNEVDSLAMQKNCMAYGYTIVENDQPCDAVVINTCSFIQPAIEESLDVIFDIAQSEAVISNGTKLVVTGCLPSRFGDSLYTELTEPDRFVTCADEDNLPAVLDELFGCSSHKIEEDILIPVGPSAYVKISDGCSRSCSYCTIPLIRGPYRSFSLDEVLADVLHQVQAGAKEIVLIAQDSGLWGKDLKTKDSLAHLLDILAQRFDTTWFRVMYLQPEGITDELLQVVASHENICNYFDIPLQHCNETLLASMNRRGSAKDYLQMIETIRKALPDVALRTTLMVGYPGETEEQFEELCDFVEQAAFDYVGIFAFSPEEGTPAAHLAQQVDEDTKLLRLQTLRDLADDISANVIHNRIGTTQTVLVLGTEEDGQWYGRAACQAPEVDGVTYLETGSVGSFVTCTIQDTLLYEMEA